MYDRGIYGDEGKTSPHSAPAPLPLPGPGICAWMAPLDLAATWFPALASNPAFQWAETKYYRVGKSLGMR